MCPSDRRPHELIDYNPAHDVVDSTKVSTAQTCMRKYFFSHILGWRPEGSSKDLDFGIAWHKAKEHLRWCHQMEGKYSADAIVGAFKHFLDHYTVAFPTAEQWEENAPKDPLNAYRALSEYVQKYKDDKFKVHMTEVTGTVPVSEDPDHQLYFKIDALIETQHAGMTVVDDKTASSDYNLADRFSMRFQFSTYIHAMGCYLGDKGSKLLAMVADVAVMRNPIKRRLLKSGKYSDKTTGKGNSFERVSIFKNMHQLVWWQSEAIAVFKSLSLEKERLQEEPIPDNPATAMKAYPANTESCFKYNKPCEFLNLCWSGRNPLAIVANLGTSLAPPGLKRHFWNPQDLDKESCTMVH